ncbi:Uncharacterised protein [Vibrio cholerae]|nr:Uncharacterised protein [Vibrio cholerae]
MIFCTLRLPRLIKSAAKASVSRDAVPLPIAIRSTLNFFTSRAIDCMARSY